MSTTETDNLIKWLQLAADAGPIINRADGQRRKMMREAADRLVSLQGEVERHNETLKRAYVALYDAAVWAEKAKPEAVGFYDSRATECREALERAGVEWDRKFPPITQVERLSQPSPAGWQLVPVEPTPQMVRAGSATQNTATGPGALLFEATETDIYRAMLAAAPSAPPQASQPRHRVGDNKSEYGHEG
jgi:hypothetical protein